MWKAYTTTYHSSSSSTWRWLTGDGYLEWKHGAQLITEKCGAYIKFR